MTKDEFLEKWTSLYYANPPKDSLGTISFLEFEIDYHTVGDRLGNSVRVKEVRQYLEGEYDKYGNRHGAKTKWCNIWTWETLDLLLQLYTGEYND